jgi:transcriptional regulator
MQPREAQMISTRDQQVVLERECGDTIVEIGQRHGISHQRVSVLVNRATEFVNKVDLDLMVARRSAEVVAILIPFGPDYTTGIDFQMWLVRRLKERGMQLDVEVRHVHNGLCLFLSDVTPRRAS